MRAQPTVSRITIGAIALLAAVGVTACSSSDSSTDTTTAAAEYKLVPAAQVTAGLAEVRTIAQSLAAARAESDTKGRAELERMYTKWFTFEGTVRKNDQDLYLQMEDGLGGMKVGVQGNKPDRIASGLAEFEAGADAYLAKHP